MVESSGDDDECLVSSDEEEGADVEGKPDLLLKQAVELKFFTLVDSEDF